MNRYLLRSAIVAALGGLLFGFDTAVIAGATSALTSLFQLTPGMLGFTVSAALWGTVLGSMLPLVFKWLGFDPGYASSPFVATFVDVTGIIIYFSIARIYLRL